MCAAGRKKGREKRTRRNKTLTTDSSALLLINTIPSISSILYAFCNIEAQTVTLNVKKPSEWERFELLRWRRWAEKSAKRPAAIVLVHGNRGLGQSYGTSETTSTRSENMGVFTYEITRLQDLWSQTLGVASCLFQTPQFRFLI